MGIVKDNTYFSFFRINKFRSEEIKFCGIENNLKKMQKRHLISKGIIGMQ